MISNEDFWNETRGVVARINDGEFPEAYEYLDGFDCEEALLDEGRFRIASMLTECDRPKRFPPFLVEYLAGLYEYEIGQGNVDAMNDLGCQYYDGGRGFEQSFAKAVKYFQMAAEHGHEHARENLGYCYYYGRDMAVDYEMAFKCFAAGALLGRPISLYRIGDMYRYGHYVRKDERQAFRIYRRCLETMDKEDSAFAAGPVHLRLGDMYLQGLGTEQDCDSALIHYNAAEVFLYRMVKDGDYMFKKSLRLAIEGQSKARAILARDIPAGEWIDEPV